MYQRCRALLAAGVGDAAAAEQWARDARSRAQEVGSNWDWLEASRALGLAALLRREPAAAVDALWHVWEHTQREGVRDPGAFPVAADLVEALVDAGDAEQAALVTNRLDTLARELSHPWAERAACCAAGDCWMRTGSASWPMPRTRTTGSELRFERARCLLALGRAQRRMKQWGAAREALTGAAEAFAALGSSGWAVLAREDLDRVGGRRPRASGELTPTERAIVELAAGGMANKEIALVAAARRPHRRGAPLALLPQARRALAGAAGGDRDRQAHSVRFPSFRVEVRGRSVAFDALPRTGCEP